MNAFRVIDFTEHENEAGQGWGDPDWSLIDDRRGVLPEFPIDVMSPEWSTWLCAAARGAGTSVDHVAIPLLSIASSLIGTSRRVKPARGWSEPRSLWTASIGFSGSGKTPGLGVTTRTLSAIEKDRRGRISELQRAHEAKVEVAKAAAKKWKAEVADAVEAGHPPPEMPAEATDPGEFIAPRLYLSDATIERIAALLQGRPSGMVMVCDELAGLFSNMARYSNGSDREFWLKAWNGSDHIVERQGRPPVVLDHLLIGLTGGLQPDVLARCFVGDHDGFYARMLFSWPDEPAYRPLSNDVAEIEPEFQSALVRLIDLPAQEDGVFAPRTIWLEDAAVREFEQFRQFLHGERNARDGREREWLAKGPAQVLRLAGTLTFMDWAMKGGVEPQTIARDHVTAAICLWHDYFWPHARAALRQIGLSDRHADARRVLRWVKTSGRRIVSLLDIRRDALGQKLDAERTLALMEQLAAANWFRDATEPHAGPGRPARRWAVNPKLFDKTSVQEMQEMQEIPFSAIPAIPA
jgi:Protein of unknown function (DUF3987)